jgi:nitrite reductase/ring-hydroxylating ferredoxin subunit
MTNGVATALVLAGRLLGRPADWQRTFGGRIAHPAAFAALLGEGAAVAAWYGRSWGRALSRRAPLDVAEGTGTVGRERLRPTAVARIDGQTSRSCAICPHLGAVVGWNDAEKSWDCPAHGSRYAADGALLEGPSRRDLRRTDAPPR